MELVLEFDHGRWSGRLRSAGQAGLDAPFHGRLELLRLLERLLEADAGDDDDQLGPGRSVSVGGRH